MLRNSFLLTFCIAINFHLLSQCPRTAEITTNTRCIFLSWSSPQSLPLPTSLVYNNETYTIIAGSTAVSATYQNNRSGNCSGMTRTFESSFIINNNTCNYSSVGILPLNFINFTSTLKANTLGVSWTTTNEVNLDYFKIEMSSNGQEWDSRVLAVNLLDERSTTKMYSTTVSGILVKPNYLRLVGVDFDGSETKTKIFSPDVLTSKEVVISPNPSNGDFVSFSCFDCSSEGSMIEILSIDGRRIKSISKIFNGDVFDVSDLTKGIYVLKISDASLKTELTKLIKN